MEGIQTVIELKQRIQQLELQREVQEKALKEEVSGFIESIKPANLIRNTLRDLSESQELKSKALIVSVGMAAGYIAAALRRRRSGGLLRQLLALALQFGSATVISRIQQKQEARGDDD